MLWLASHTNTKVHMNKSDCEDSISPTVFPKVPLVPCWAQLVADPQDSKHNRSKTSDIDGWAQLLTTAEAAVVLAVSEVSLAPSVISLNWWLLHPICPSAPQSEQPRPT